MRTAIMGAGALGTLFGALMTKNGKPVDMIDANKEHIAALKANGATIIGGINLVQKVSALTPDEMTGQYDLVFLLTKQTANHIALPHLTKFLHKDSVVCTLQNGVPEEYVASFVGKERTIGGAVAPAAQWVRPGVSQFNSTENVLKQFAFEIGEIDGTNTPRLKNAQEYLGAVGKTLLLDNLMGLRWSKLKINSTGSGMSAALGQTFGANIDSSKVIICMAFIADEVIKTAHAQNIKLVPMQGADIDSFELSGPQDIPALVPKFKELWERHRPSKASMMFDLERGLDCEIDYINGLVAKKGRELGIATPFNDRVVELVREAQARRGLNNPAMISRFEDLFQKYAPGLTF
ncbi:MAG: ketopantoate reductase family protein [Deltaproteobacteria bacterium]|jgi:2-dehydropantoate 2-reductase|nr:ketopantoate reductase family protein [Deltaproteobacteria bacterium]